MVSDMAMVIVISIFSMYLILSGIVFFLFRKPMKEAWRRRFMLRRGFGYIRINGNDHRVREYFKDLKQETVKINNHKYILDPKKCKFVGNAGLFEFKEGIAEAIDVYGTELIGTDSNFLDNFLLKLKSLARLSAEDKMKFILYAAIGAIIVGAIAAVLAYTNYNTLQDLTKFLIK